MGFFDSLRRVLGGESAPGDASVNVRQAGAWNVDDEGDPATSAEPLPFEGGEYDRKNWRKKLKLILEDLPASKDKWPDHIADAHSLGIEPGTIQDWCREEFTLLIRRIVSDRVVTEAEHRKLDLARDLLQIPDAEAEAILHDVVADAEKFFGGTVEGA
jgi:hypothetical protein